MQVPAFAGQVQEPVLLYVRVRVELAAGRVRVELAAGAGRVWDEKFFVRVLQMSVEPKHMNLISSKIAKHVDVLKLFASIAFRTVGPQQL